jgi:hypothetical protein
VSWREVFDESAYMLFYERCDGELPPHAAAPLSDWGCDALAPSPSPAKVG